MTDVEIKLLLAGLLHDIGKVTGGGEETPGKHSQTGYAFLKRETGLGEKCADILEAVLYHHGEALENAGLREDSFAYLVAFADGAAAAAEGREAEDTCFAPFRPLRSIFNILNGNDGRLHYEPRRMDRRGGINYPVKEPDGFGEAFYRQVREDLKERLREPELSREYAEALMGTLETDLSWVPASEAAADISLYDHLKLTAAMAGCLYGYLQEKGTSDYRGELFVRKREFYDEEAFLLYSMDVSGIQDFIYTIADKNALKTLRARSFYLEIMMEHIADRFLEGQRLSRANLLYSGGGRCYLLLPNTERAAAAAESFVDTINSWLLEHFRISLYVAAGSAPCSANTLGDRPAGSYPELFRRTGAAVSGRKSSRYSAEDIRRLNSGRRENYTRECRVCRRTEKVDGEGVCALCRNMEKFSAKILYGGGFLVSRKESDGALPLPGGCFLTSENASAPGTKRGTDPAFVRAYGKNSTFSGDGKSVRLWVGDYTAGKTFEEYAAQASGISRIGILRADVDNLGQAFSTGFENPRTGERYAALARTAALSHHLSLFFKYDINHILEEGAYSLTGKKPHPRNAVICYSGGDDLFIVGAWDEIIELAVDIRRSFERYTQGALTLSAGIGVYPSGYPLSAMAAETADLEDASKQLPGKNAVTLLSDGGYHVTEGAGGRKLLISDGTYGWPEFEQEVLGEKYELVREFFDTSEERGKGMMYHLLDLIRNREDKINFARFVYLLSRLEPERDAPAGEREQYKRFSAQMLRWIRDGRDCRQLRTAMSLYAYLTREKEALSDEDR